MGYRLPVRALQTAVLFLVFLSFIHLATDRTRDGALSWYPSSAGHGRLHLLAREQKILGDIHGLKAASESSQEYKFNSGVGGYKWYTDSKLRSLTACSIRGDCHPNAHKVAIMGAYHCHIAVFNNYLGGEGVWCNGMIQSLERQGYTVLLARNDWEYIYHIHRQIPDLVKVIIADPKGDGRHYEDWLKSEERPDGVPAWKFFFFYYYPNHFSTVVGNKWVVTAEPPVGGEKNTYLGYNLEPNVIKGVVPFKQRQRRVFMLGKYTWFFYDKLGHQSWDPDFYQRVTDELRQRWPDFEIVAAMTDGREPEDIEAEGPHVIPPGIRNLGRLDSVEFDQVISNSRLLLGIGRPGLSPSPYRALTPAVPFLNPYWDRHWFQHNTIGKKLQEPYVYNVEAFNYEAFRDAIVKAMETPIEPWVVPWMDQDAFDKRMDDLMNHDWRADAAAILEERKKGNETQTNTANAEGGQLSIFEL